MADTLKNLYGGLLSTNTGLSTLYTVPTSTKTIIKEIIICNYNSNSSSVTISINGINIIANKSIPASETYVIELHSIIESGKSITGLVSAGTMPVYISGIEVTQ